MALYRMLTESIEPLPATTFAALGVLERADLQRLLRTNIEVIDDDLLVIAEEFAEWDDSRRRIDLLAVDRDANLVVIELKRDDDGGRMELQALRYAAMVSSMTYERAVEVYQGFLDAHGLSESADEHLRDFLAGDDPIGDGFGRDVRIVLVAADFSKELTTSVLWLNDRDLDIRCVRLKPYALSGETVIDAQQIIPLPEALEYQVRVREKAISQRESARAGKAPTGYGFMNAGEGKDEGRSWDDCRNHGFMSAGGGQRYVEGVRKLRVGDRLFAYLSGHGYVGLGEVIAEAVPEDEFVPPGQDRRLVDLPRRARANRAQHPDPAFGEWYAAVRWINAVEREQAVLKNKFRRGTIERIRQPDLVAELLTHFGTPGDTDP